MNPVRDVLEAFQVSLLESIARREFRNISGFLSRLDVLQEQPQLIDPWLEKIIDPVLNEVQQLTALPISHFLADCYHVLYYYTKIRGAKVIVKFFPNHVSLLEPIVLCLGVQPLQDATLWHARYILLLWLSLISMAPFDLNTFDRTLADPDQTRIEIVDRLVPISEQYLSASGKEREAAGLLIARLLTRKDVNEFYIPEFLDRAMLLWHTEDCTLNYRIGLLTCLCEIFKIGNRDVLLAHVDVGFAAIRQMDGNSELLGNTLLRKLRLKLAQRLSLTLLRPNRASWRYRNELKLIRGTIVQDEEIVEDPPVPVEETIGLLLEGLQDKDTVVRYSAAKGIGRITSRLPIAYAMEVQDAIRGILDADIKTDAGSPMLSDQAKDSTWHGSALAIAELCRNGALIPSALHDILPLIFVAIQFDIKKGSHSIGSAVRDAACYVMWSILRTYQTAIILPFAKDIATKLIAVAMFDREISVRRAASAAYQEGVGRHPDNTFPDGIAVLSKADFMAVGQRRTSFLEVAPDVFSHQGYRSTILDHLVRVSCIHWDREVRELAGQTIGKLLLTFQDFRTNELGSRTTGSDVSALVSDLLSTLERHIKSVDVNARHGSLYTAGEICSALSGILQKHGVGMLENGLLERLVKFGLGLPDYNFNGPQASTMRQAVCHYITRVTTLDIQVSKGLESLVWQEESINRHNDYLKMTIGAFSLQDERARLTASKAIGVLYLLPHIESAVNAMLMQRAALNNVRNPAVLRGWLTFLGVPQYDPKSLILSTVLDILLESAKITGDPTRDDPETRKIALYSLGHLLPLLPSRSGEILELDNLSSRILCCLTAGLNDYTVDSRGDVGSWVREAAICASCCVFRSQSLWAAFSADIPTRIKRLFCDCIAQCLGKIDNLRVTATTELGKAVLDVTQDVLHEEDQFTRLVCQVGPVLAKSVDALQTGEPSLALFQLMLPLLEIPELRPIVLREYLITGSSGSQSTMNLALSSVTTYLDSLPSASRVLVISDILVLIESSGHDDRTLIPVLSSTADLLDSQIFTSLTSDNSEAFDFELLFVAIQKSTLNSTNIPKISASLRCYAALATLDRPVKYRAWKKLALGLNHRFPNVRVMCAEFGFQVLSNLGIEDQDEMQPVVEALTNADWSMGVDKEKMEIVKAFILP